ncbi:S8/S53 family peptidase [Pedobacter insulae]|uniref:Por secretion system C-terminal sorting domain-containing protein n=1 Tax=Pedobacter insulae TaxID=414048 RepID=A0A1I2ZBG5_9SPHI|nr:S8/S53 family peptidase [Pedobacter insulae]SFH34955.1 Por secretion system C-terminal sorting domain-containing protein [Pedobacter insulae]
MSFNSYAQIANKETNVAFLRENAVAVQQKIEANRQKAFSVAKEKGWETLRVTKTGAVIALQGIDDLGLPIYFITDNNSTAAITTSTHKLYTGGGLGLSLSGSTIPNDKVAIWDGGLILTSHTEFAPTRIKPKDNATTLSSHATHVAGTMMASGVNPIAKGMSYGLPQLSSFDFNSDVAEMSANAATLLISNHSYGAIAGWQYNSDVTPARWEFWGAPGENEDFKFGYYNNAAKEWDLICYNAPYYLPVKSAGNSRNENGPAVGEPYYRFNSAGTMVSAGNRPAGISSNNGYDIISTYGTAKNILTVGAINPLPFGPISTESIQISNFSSCGPTDDGRIKPDLVGDGVNVTSTTSSSPTTYATLSGTSMSSPNVSGSLVLLQELYSQKNAGAYMRSATLKALVLGTATEAGIAPGPDYIFGWGLLNTEAAAKAILNKNAKSLINENSLAQGSTQTINLIASGDGPLIATICWTDPEATPVSSATALDNPILRLVNDLDISVKDAENNVYRAWVLDPANPSAPATTGDNFRDNVEQVYIANAIPGKSYTLTISHKGTLLRGPQAFSIVATGVGGAIYCSSSANNILDSKITNFKLSNIDYTADLNCTGYSNLTSQVINLEKGKTYPLSLTLGTCGSGFNKIAKVFIDWNGDGDFSDTEELVATSQVVSTTGIFSTSVSVPDLVNVNNFSLFRIVLTETNDPANVSSCGVYAKGETIDYRVNFLQPAVDVALTAIVNPTGTICASPDQKVTITLKNDGTQSLTAVPVTVIVSENGTPITTLSATFKGSIPYLNEVDFTLPLGFNAQPGKTYSLVAKTNLPGDLNSTNNELSGSFQVGIPPVATTGSAFFCTNLNAYNLNVVAPASSTAFWYKNATDTNPIEFGSTTATTVAPGANRSYHVGINDFKADIGPSTKAELGEGGYNQFTPGITVTTLVPITLESARLYIGNSGQIRFTVVNSAGTEVSSVLLRVTATKTKPAAGATANDPTDLGQIYPLNLTLPKAGSFTINIEYLEGATIFRNNNATATAYPYQTTLNLFSLTGNTATLANSPNYFKTFYYYFYDLKVRSAGCMGGERLAVSMSEPIITQRDNLLSSSSLTGNKWFLNGEPIAGATNQTYTPLKNGEYTVEVLSETGCAMRSTAITVTDVKNMSTSPINLKVYPVPTDDDLTVSFEVADRSMVKIQVSNLLGQVVFKEEKVNFNGLYTNTIRLNAFAAGIYVLSVRIGSKVYTRKISLIK